MPRRCWCLAVSLFLVGGSGCAPANREQLAAEIRKRDPDFAVVLEKHQEIANRIKTYERELALKRSTIERNIAQLRKELADTSASVRLKIAEAKTRMEPDRQRLSLALAMASEELRAKQLQRASLGRSVANLKKAAKSSGEAWSAKERSAQADQMDQMVKDATRLDQEIAAMHEHIRLLKIKLILIKF